MGRYVVRRLLQLLPTLVGITLVTFVLAKLAPGEVGSLGEAALRGLDQASLAAYRHSQALDVPIWRQYVDWLWHSLHFDFGYSLVDAQPVAGRLASALPTTLLLAGSALAVTYVCAVPLGIWAALSHHSRVGRGITLATFVFYSLPPFWVALVLLVMLAGGEPWQLLPLRGMHSTAASSFGAIGHALDTGWHLLLPVFCLAYPAVARTSRYQRAAMLEVLQQDYLLAARARGLSERVVIFRHALRNALAPMAALLSVDLPYLLGGSVIIERIFTLPGMGMLAFEAVLRRDYPVIMGLTTTVAVFSMLALFAGDLLQLWIDPRARRSVV